MICSIDVNIISAILNVYVIYIVIKYLYVNVIWFFNLVIFYFCVCSCYQLLHIYPILRLPVDQTYLKAKNTVSNIRTCYSLLEG